MMHTTHRTWDRALLAWAVGGDRGKSVRAALVVVLVVGLGVGLLPGVAQADYGPPGLNDAQIDLSDDGYDPDTTTYAWEHGKITVTGKSFKPSAVAQIFQCPEGATDLQRDCLPIGSAPTDPDGNFGPADVVVLHSFATVNAPLSQFCRGTVTQIQCSVVAATLGPTLQPTSRAEHLICYPVGSATSCKPKPAIPPPTTISPTTTTQPNGPSVSMSQDGYDGYYPGERLTPVFGDTTKVDLPPLPVVNEPVDGQYVTYTAPIDVFGQDFLPNDVVEIFQCPAGYTGYLRTPPRTPWWPNGACAVLATATTDEDGSFIATVSLDFTRGCRGGGGTQCSVIAATFDRTDPGIQVPGRPGVVDYVTVGEIEPTSRGENYVCFEGPEPCANKPGAPVETTTTTTTVVPPPITHNVADFDGNGSSDVSVFRPSTGTWYVKDSLSTNWGIEGDIAVPADYDGDGSTEVAVFRPSNGVWYFANGGAVGFGIDGDIPVPGDYDGNGSAEVAVFRPSNGVWYFANGGGTAWGADGDIPVPGDYDGNGSTDIAVFRPSNGVWYLANGITAAFGIAGDIPVPGDYDADASETTEIAVFRPSNGTWYIYGQGGFAWGASGDVPVPGHYDADPLVDIGVFRPSNGAWYIDGQPQQTWGGPGDIPLALPPAIYHASF